MESTPTPSKEHANNPLFPIEKSNRIVSLLFLVFLIVFFMDYQARRHYNSVRVESKASSFDEDLEAAQKKLESELKKQKGRITDTLPSNSVESVEVNSSIQPQKAKSETIIGGAWSSLKAKISTAAKKQKAAEILGAEATKSNASKVLSALAQKGNNLKNPPMASEQIMHQLSYYWLYFIRFSGKKSKLIRVKRPHKPGPLRLSQVLLALRAGPKIHEKGLLNNFDHRMKVNYIRRNGAGVLIDLNPAIGRMGAHVIHDRLEQIAHTLTQFAQISYVKISVEGQSPNSIGEAGVILPQALYPQRSSFPFSENI